jgi:poly(3-hydroxybutyrate) depolymerase
VLDNLNGRKFLLAVPPRGLPLPLGRVPGIIDWHGYTESPHYQNELTGMSEVAAEYGWVAAIPFGTAPVHTETCCPLGASDEDCQASHGRCGHLLAGRRSFSSGVVHIIIIK